MQAVDFGDAVTISKHKNLRADFYTSSYLTFICVAYNNLLPEIVLRLCAFISNCTFLNVLQLVQTIYSSYFNCLVWVKFFMTLFNISLTLKPSTHVGQHKYPYEA